MIFRALPAGVGTRTEYLYDGQMPVCEQDFRNGVLQQGRVHFLGGRGIEAVVAINHARGNQASLRWLLYDGHGNLVRTMSPDYTLSGFQWRGIWGEMQGSLGAGRGYCANLGHPEDETGLVYMRARYYEPATGRFISEDPTRDGVNWYLYADGNPVNEGDIDGKWAFLLPMLLGAALGALSSIGFQYLIYGSIDWGDVAISSVGGAIGGIAGWAIGIKLGIQGGFIAALLGKARLDIGKRLLRWALGGAVRSGSKALLSALFDGNEARELNGPLGKALSAHAGNNFVLFILANYLEEGLQGLL